MTRNSMIEIAGLILCAGIFIAVEGSGQAPPFRGKWSLNNWTSGNEVRLELVRHTLTSTSSWGGSHPMEELQGLTRDQLHSAHSKVKFTIEKDAGIFAFEGAVTLGVGQGEYDFIASNTYIDKLNAMGYRNVDRDDLFWMAVQDISLGFAREVREAGLRDATTDDLKTFKTHGIDIAYIRDLSMLGYTALSSADLVNLKNHGVDISFLRGLKKAGYNMSADDVVTLHNHGVDEQYMAGLKAAGYQKAGVEDITNLRNHGIDGSYLSRLQSSGFTSLTTEQIMRLHDHGVD